MKIAIISSDASSLNNFRGPLIAELVQRGHQVYAFAPDYQAQSRAEMVKLGAVPVEYSLVRSSTNPIREIFSIIQLRKKLIFYQPDVCLSYFVKPVIYGTIAAWLANVKYRYGLIEGLGFAFTTSVGQNKFRNRLQKIISILARFSFSKLDRLVFLNPDDLNEFVQLKLLDADKAYLLGAIGLDLNFWQPAPFPKGPTTFILVARLLKDKGIFEYANAARIVKQSYPNTKFILVGTHDENPAAIPLNAIETWVDEGLFEWPGFVDVKLWLAKAHVFVLPSYREGVPRSTQEAMALGRPVITTDVAGCRETVVQGQNGYLVPPRDPSALADSMIKFISNPLLIPKMGKESRIFAETKFDVTKQNLKLLNCMMIE